MTSDFTRGHNETFAKESSTLMNTRIHPCSHEPRRMNKGNNNSVWAIRYLTINTNNQLSNNYIISIFLNNICMSNNNNLFVKNQSDHSLSININQPRPTINHQLAIIGYQPYYNRHRINHQFNSGLYHHWISLPSPSSISLTISLTTMLSHHQPSA